MGDNNNQKLSVGFSDINKTLSLLEAALESTTDGILIVDREGKISRFNNKFLNMWRIPKEIVATHDDDKAIKFVLDQLAEPELFLAKVRELYSKPEAESFDTLLFKDGRVFERYSIPQKIGSDIVGRVWSFRDVTARVRSEQKEKEYLKALESANKLLVERQTSMIDIGNRIPAGEKQRIDEVLRSYSDGIEKLNQLIADIKNKNGL